MKALNKAFVNGKIYNVINLDELTTEYIQYYNGTLAVHYMGYILPIYLQSPNGNYIKPGAYFDSIGYNLIIPFTEEDAQIYSDCHLAYFGDAESFQDILQAKEKLYEDEYNHLISNDDVFIPHMDQSQDTALMFAVKSAIAAKQCNINNYAERFGSDFNNDKRKFNGKSITAGKAESILSNTDVRVTLVIQDMTPDVANPIGKTLVFPWIGDGVNDDAYVNYINDAISAKGPIKLGG
jgi:hypothetical protein